MLKRLSFIIAVWAFTAVSASAECYCSAGGGWYTYSTWKGIGGGQVSAVPSRTRRGLIASVRTATRRCKSLVLHYKRGVAMNYPDDITSGHHFFDDEVEICEDYFESQLEMYVDHDFCYDQGQVC